MARETAAAAADVRAAEVERCKGDLDRARAARDREIVNMAAVGWPTAAIARRLDLSVTHVRYTVTRNQTGTGQ